MAHAQKPYFVFRAKGTRPFKSAGASVQSTTGSRGERISGSNAGYTIFRGSVKGTDYPLHSPVSPSLRPPVRHRVPSHFNWSLLHASLELDTRCGLEGLRSDSHLYATAWPATTVSFYSLFV